MAIAPGGGPVVADLGTGQVFRLLPDGRPDLRFGDGGRLSIGPWTLSGSHRHRLVFSPTSVAVDHAGRLVIFGDQSDLRRSVDLPILGPAYSSYAIVLRFDPNGRRDASFGNGKGYVRDDFGIASPLTSEFPLVGVLAGIVDSRNRPVLIAGSASLEGPCTLKTELEDEPRAVVRLTSGGAPDRTFGSDGISAIEGATSFPELQIAGDGQLAIEAGPIGATRPHCGQRGVVYRLGQDGQRSGRFGTEGVAFLERMHLAALEPSGGVIISRRSTRALILSRLSPAGVRDPTFGRRGTVRIELPPGPSVHVASVLVDGRGGLLIAGFSRGRPAKKEHASFFATRISARGKVGLGSAAHGWLRTKFPLPLELTSAQAMLDPQGRLVVAGTASTPHENNGGFLVARYLNAR